MVTRVLHSLFLLSAVGFSALSFGAGAGRDPNAAPPVAAPAALPAIPGPEAGLPSIPAMPMPGDPGIMPAAPMPGGMPLEAPGGALGVPASPASSVPTPPPLTTLGLTDSATTGTTTTAAGQAEIYEFLFREDEELGVVRDKYTPDQAQMIRNAEMARIQQYSGVAGAGGGPGASQGGDPMAVASWDLYFQQLELYSKYVKERVLGGSQDIPEPQYSTQNYMQDRDDIRSAYELAAITMSNSQTNENRDFYELRLQAREDRRRDYYDWIASQQRALDEWTRIWARKINGSRWIGESVRLDDWYYGVNFASRDPVQINIDGQSYVISRDPERNVAPNQLNVLSTNLTPYDIIDGNGVLKTPEMERLRGTLVRPVAEGPTTGTIEIVE